MEYPSGAFASIRACHLSSLENTATILGDKGRITWPFFWSPDRFFLTDDQNCTTEIGCETTNPEYGLPPTPDHEEYFFPRSNGLAFEVEYFQGAVERGLKESEWQSHAESLAIMETIDLIAEQIGFNNQYGEAPQ